VVSPIPNKDTLKSFINNKYQNKCGFTLELNQNGNNIDISSALRGVTMLETLIIKLSILNKKIGNLPNDKKSVTLTADITGLLKINDILG